jgi:hypothetical protein
MDFVALQQKLFDLDPSDRAQDLRRLTESVGDMPHESAQTEENFVQESVEDNEAAAIAAAGDLAAAEEVHQVPQGAMPVEGDYSLSDFAALAGVTLNESQKTGSAGQLKGKDPMPKAKARGKHPHVDKLVGEDLADVSRAAQDSAKNSITAPDGAERYLKKKFGIGAAPKAKPEPATKGSKPVVAKAGDWKGFLKQHSAQLQKISADPKKKRQFDAMMAKMGEGVQEARSSASDQAAKAGAYNGGKSIPKQKKTAKATDPKSQERRDAAVAKMRDEDKAAKKAQRDRFAAMKNESIKEMLYRKLNATK